MIKCHECLDTFEVDKKNELTGCCLAVALGYGDLNELYLDWWNDFISVEGFASYHGISKKAAWRIIDEAREYYNSYVETGV